MKITRRQLRRLIETKIKLTKRQFTKLLSEIDSSVSDDIEDPIVVQVRDVERIRDASKQRDEELLKMMKKRDEELLKMMTDLKTKLNLKENSSKVKLTRRQLRRLIEGSIKKRGDYVIPAEEPLTDPVEDLDFSDEHKGKIKSLALTDDPETRIQADVLADIGGFEGTDRFGADTFSKQVRAEDLGIDTLTDPYIDSAMSSACDYWIYENKDYLSYYKHIDQDTFRKYADYIIEEYDGDQAIVNEIKVHTTAVLDKRIESLIQISNSAAAVPSVDEKVAKLKNAKKLFSPNHNNPAVEDHIIFKFESVLYPFYLDWKKYYMSGERDIPEEELTPELKAKFANIKEGRR